MMRARFLLCMQSLPTDLNGRLFVTCPRAHLQSRAWVFVPCGVCMRFVQGLSIACSTPEAVCWDPTWANTHEISGRAMKNVHDSAEGFQYERRQEMKEKRAADDFVGESLGCWQQAASKLAAASSGICSWHQG